MTKKQTPKDYSGVLSAKLHHHGKSDFPTDLINFYCAMPSAISKRFEDKVYKALDAACFDFTEERRAKLPALFAHFGIKMNAPNSWRKLASSLAMKHVPGFQVENRKRPKLGRAWSDFELWAKIKLIQLEGVHEVTRASELLWKRTGKKGSARTIRRRFTAAQVELDPIFSDLGDDMLKEILSRGLEKPKKKPRPIARER